MLLRLPFGTTDGIPERFCALSFVFWSPGRYIESKSLSFFINNTTKEWRWNLAALLRAVTLLRWNAAGGGWFAFMALAAHPYELLLSSYTSNCQVRATWEGPEKTVRLIWSWSSLEHNAYENRVYHNNNVDDGWGLIQQWLPNTNINGILQWWTLELDKVVVLVLHHMFSYY